ncbi:MAG: AI-2E family transporter [Caldilineaceae bacterium]
MPSPRWNNITKVIVTTALVIFVILVVVAFRVMIPPTIVAFLFAFILGYPVNWIQRQTGWARGPAVAALYLILLLLVVLMPVLVLPRASNLFTSLQQTLESLIGSLQTAMIPIGHQTIPADQLLQPLSDALQNILSVATTNSWSIFRGVTTGVLTVVYVMVLNFWLLKDFYKLQRLLFEQIPVDYQEDVRRLAQEIIQIWEGFLRGQMVLALVVGVITWIPLAIVGMANAGGLALLAGVMELLPTVGPGISGTIGVLVALFQGSTWLPLSNVTFALLVLAIYAVIAQVESVYLIPRLVGGRVKLHPAVAFVCVIGGALVFGALGVLVATPVVASTRTIIAYLYRKLLDRAPFEPQATLQSTVRIRGLVGGRKIEAIVFDLDGTLTEVDWRTAHFAARRLAWLGWIVPAEQRCYYTRRMMIGLEGLINFLISQLARSESPEHLERALPLFNLLRGYPPPETLTLQQGVAVTLQYLRRHYQLALVSTRDRHSIHKFLMETGLDDGIFQLVVTREDVRNLLPHSESLHLLTEQLQLNPDQILIVSDTDVNLRSGRAMGMGGVGTLCGLGQAETLRDADLLITAVPELQEWL